MSDLYPYAQGDLISAPNTYFYAAYGGRDFIAAWRATRAAVHAKAVPPPPPRRVPLPLLGREVVTDDLLEALLNTLDSEQEIPPVVWDWMALLVKKLETTKRIHRAYDSRFLAVDKGECRDLGRYLRLAEVITAAARRRPGLVLLNALLKLVDTLVAHAGGLDMGQMARLATVITFEDQAVAMIERGGEA